MQIGIRLHDTLPLTLEERLRTIRQQGYTCAHVALSKTISEFPVGSGALTPGLAMYLRRIFDKNEIDFAVLGCYLNLAHPDPKKLISIKNTYMAHIRFASLLGCGVVGTETGAPNAAYEYEAACHSEEALQLFIRNLSSIVSYAEAMGVILAIEPVRSHIVYDAKRTRRVLQEINSPNLQVILDPVNLLGIDNYKEQTRVIDQAIELLGEDVAVIHMKDFLVKGNMLMNTVVGMGGLIYNPIIDFIRSKKPYIHCILEETVPDNAVTARKYINKMWSGY
jgi:L-ribulose-5-phosphate 3-epimerase